MNILPPPVVPESGQAKVQPAVNGTPLSKNGPADNAAQASFPATLAQANQQGASPKAVLTGKDPSGNGSSLSVTQGEVEGEGEGIIGAENTEGAQLPVTPLVLQQGVLAAGQESAENALTLSLVPKTSGEPNTGNPSQTFLKPPTSILAANEPKTLGVAQGTSLLPSTGTGTAAPQGEVDSVISQISSTAKEPVNSQILQLPSRTNTNEQQVIPTLAREAQVPLQSDHRFLSPSVPLSFVSSVLPQGQPIVDTSQATKLSQAIPQTIQGTLPGASGTPSVTVIDGTGSSHLSVEGEGHAESGGSSLGSDQRSGQEQGAAFTNKQQASGQTLGGFSLNPESGSEFRVSEPSSTGRSETLADRTRTMNLLSPQRMQMEVMLSDESKVQVEVAVKQQQVTAQLLTDQMMLRNLALQHEPQLDAQLSSVGLDLKQFGAEVSEQGLFGQHLSDSSSQKFQGGGGHEVSNESEPEELVGASVEADGRLHYVA